MSTNRPKLIDSHTHVQFAAFSGDSDKVIKRALDENIWLVNVGTQKNTSRLAVETAEKYANGVFAAVGLHPVHTEKSFHDEDELGGDKGFTGRGEEFDYDYYQRLAENPKVVAIGECGLDFFRTDADKLPETKKKQESAFRAQIKLAGKIKKPLMIHCRAAFPDLIKILEDYFKSGNIESPGIIHFFSGTEEEAKKLLGMGFYFTFGGVITFTRAYDGVVKMIPLERIMTETDAPYVAPAPYRGKRNEPVYVTKVAEKIAEIKNISLVAAEKQMVENAFKIFGF